MAAVKETETSEELFISLVGLIFFLGLRSACIASAYGLDYTTDLPMASEKKSNLGKKSSSMVSFFYRPKNSLETEYIFHVHGSIFPLPMKRYEMIFIRLFSLVRKRQRRVFKNFIYEIWLFFDDLRST